MHGNILALCDLADELYVDRMTQQQGKVTVGQLREF